MRINKPLLFVSLLPFVAAVSSAQSTPFTIFDEMGDIGSRFGEDLSVVPIETPVNVIGWEAIAISRNANLFFQRPSAVEVWAWNSSITPSGWSRDIRYQATSAAIGNNSFGSSIALRSDPQGGYQGIIGQRFGLSGSTTSGDGLAYEINDQTPNDSPLTFTFGGSLDAELGASCAEVDLVAGDGAQEYLIGSPMDGTTGQGTVFVIDKATSATIYQLIGTGAGAGFGESIALLGDTDGDGDQEFVVGAPGLGGNGAAYAYSGTSTTPYATINGTTLSRTGETVGNAGDLNGDGVDDFYVGSPNYLGLGRIRAFNGLNGAQLAQFLPNAINATIPFGSLIAAGRDLDGDSVPDLVVPSADASELFHVYSGATGGISVTVDRDASDVAEISDMVLIDPDGFGRSYVAVGQASFAPGFPSGGNYGRVRFVLPMPEFGYRYCTPLVPNVTGAIPALTASGSNVIADNSLEITVDGLPFRSLTGVRASLAPTHSGFALPGDFNCIASGSELQFISNANFQGTVSGTIDLQSPLLSGVMAGQAVYFQAAYRDQVTGGLISRPTGALAIVLQ